MVRTHCKRTSSWDNRRCLNGVCTLAKLVYYIILWLNGAVKENIYDSGLFYHIVAICPNALSWSFLIFPEKYKNFFIVSAIDEMSWFFCMLFKIACNHVPYVFVSRCITPGLLVSFIPCHLSFVADIVTYDLLFRLAVPGPRRQYVRTT